MINECVKHIYEITYYILLGKTKITQGMNLDFYDLDDTTIKDLFLYENQTVRYKDQWFVVKRKKKYSYKEEDQKTYPQNWIKYPYKKAVAIE